LKRELKHLLSIHIQYNDASYNEESIEGIEMNKAQTDSSEPYFYIALVLKGTEKQYLNLLKYVNGRNGARVIYQCKSLTYLHVSHHDDFRSKASALGFLVNAEHQKVETP